MSKRQSQMQFQLLDKKWQKERDEMLQRGIKKTKQMKANVSQLRQGIKDDMQNWQIADKKMDSITRTAQRTNNKMQRYLQRTSNCKMYVIIACQLLIFLILMSI